MPKFVFKLDWLSGMSMVEWFRDSDCAGDLSTKRSTSGGYARLAFGCQINKCWFLVRPAAPHQDGQHPSAKVTTAESLEQAHGPCASANEALNLC